MIIRFLLCNLSNVNYIIIITFVINFKLDPALIMNYYFKSLTSASFQYKHIPQVTTLINEKEQYKVAQIRNECHMCNFKVNYLK